MSEISKDSHRFTLRQNRATLGFSFEAELAQLRSRHEMEQMTTIAVLESLNCLSESSEHKLCQLSGRKTVVRDEGTAGRKKLLEKESAELEQQSNSARHGTHCGSFLASLGRKTQSL